MNRVGVGLKIFRDIEKSRVHRRLRFLGIKSEKLNKEVKKCLVLMTIIDHIDRPKEI